MLCAYYDFNVYFFKSFVSHVFWTNLVPKSNVLQIDWNLIQGCSCMLITSLMRNFSNHLPFINLEGGHISSPNLFFSIFTEISHRGKMKFRQFGENKIGRNFPIIFWTRKLWKTRSFNYNKYIILIMYIKLDSSQLKQHQVLGPNLKNLKHKP